MKFKSIADGMKWLQALHGTHRVELVFEADYKSPYTVFSSTGGVVICISHPMSPCGRPGSLICRTARDTLFAALKQSLIDYTRAVEAAPRIAALPPHASGHDGDWPDGDEKQRRSRVIDAIHSGRAYPFTH